MTARRRACARRRTRAPSRGRSLPGAARWTTTGLGAYRYLVHLALDEAPHDRLCEAVERLLGLRRAPRDAAARPRSSSTSPTARVGTTTARKLFIHANTLRQRLDRIQKLTGLDLATEDLLSLELAVKLVRLRRAGGAESATQILSAT